MCSCLDRVTKTSAYGLDLASPPGALEHTRRSGKFMAGKAQESGRRDQHPLRCPRGPAHTPNIAVNCFMVRGPEPSLIAGRAVHHRLGNQQIHGETLLR